MFADEISNFRIISVLELSWDEVDAPAIPRPYHALSFRIKGDATFTVAQKKITANKNDLIFVPQDLGYTLSAKNEHLFCIHFLAENINSDEIFSFSPSNSIIFDKLFASIYNCWTQKKTGYIAEVTSSFYKIISKMQIQQNKLMLSAYSDNMSYVLEYIHEHFTDSNLTIGKLSEIASISESYFRKQFKVYFGESPLKYINNLRVKYALELINSNYYKIYEIAEKAGFSDPKYFSTVIKKATKMAPSKISSSISRDNTNNKNFF